jgi:septal ring factor EnvC (AmiA/AmiB activator)
MSHSPKPHTSSQPANIQPTTTAEVAQKLDQILSAITPLHKLLAAQEKSDTTLTDRLSRIMEDLGSAAESLQMSANALNQIIQAGHLRPAQQTAFNHLSVRLDQMEKHLITLSSWLGAPVDISAELTSSATS